MAHNGSDGLEHAELVLFRCQEGYVYLGIPSASTIGHRAELWDVDKWHQEVAIAVVTCEADCWVRLLDKKTGELFAECPVPKDQPLVVEPVVDSSRYYVLRVEDRTTKRHAFLGVGFRERAHASDFNAALHEHQQYLRRRREADAMRQQYEADTNGESEDGAGPRQQRDYRLQEGQTLHIALPDKAMKSSSISKTVARVRAAVGAAPLKMQVSGSGALLPPPPALSSPMPSTHVAQDTEGSPFSRALSERDSSASRGMQVSGGPDTMQRRDSGGRSDGSSPAAGPSPLGSSSPRSGDVIAGLGQLQLRRSAETAIPAAACLRPAPSFTSIDRPLLSRLSGDQSADAAAERVSQQAQQAERGGPGSDAMDSAADQKAVGAGRPEGEGSGDAQEQATRVTVADGQTARDAWGDFVG